MDRVTFASSSGFVWLSLAAHFAAGLTAIVAGAVALAVTKGGRPHRQSGMVFTCAMVGLGLTAVGIGAHERIPGQVFAGLLAAYFVYSAMATVRPVTGFGRRLDIALMVLALGLAAALLHQGAIEWLDPSVTVVGRPSAVPPLIGGSLVLLAAIGDLRAIRAGGLQGAPRLTRHLWRMCFALFIATGSFFIGQMKFIPEPARIVPLLLVLGFAPLAFLVFRMWRVRTRGL
jgi:uncharacterized membrane protein